MPAQLLALTDGPSILLDKPILLLGRHGECDIQLNSRKVSRRHCCLAQVNDYLVVRDLGSTNGIRINGQRVLEGKLRSGDELTVGNFRYQVHLGGEAPVVYGSRYLGGRPARPWWSPYRLAVGGLNRLGRLLYGQRLTDHATCYKAMATTLWRALDLRAERFELCAEVTAKLGRLGIPIREVPIAYRPRTRAEGKKIGWRDGLAALRALVRWRFTSVGAAGDPRMSPGNRVGTTTIPLPSPVPRALRAPG